MLSLLAACLIAPPGDRGAMAPADYKVKSDVTDDSAPGGFGTSENGSWGIKDVGLTTKGVVLTVKKNDCCGPGGECEKIVVFANGGDKVVWLRAEDSRLNLVREAKDKDGAWHPVEFLVQSTCGNSAHRVALNPGRCWVWDVPKGGGTFATKCRYVLYGPERPLLSNEFDSSIDLAAFALPESWAATHMLSDRARLVLKTSVSR